MDTHKKPALASLFMQTGQAHHHAFKETDGADPEWALWYAAYLKEKLPEILGTEMTQSRIVYELIRLDDTADVSQVHWTEVYAEELLRKYA